MLQLPQSARWLPAGQACDATAQPMAQTSRGFRATSPGFGMRVLPGSQQNTNSWWLPSPRAPTSPNGKGRAGAPVTNGHVTRAVSFWENHVSSSMDIGRGDAIVMAPKEIGGNVKPKAKFGGCMSSRISCSRNQTEQEQKVCFMQPSPGASKLGTRCAQNGCGATRMSGCQPQAERATQAGKLPRRISSVRSVAPLPNVEAFDVEPGTSLPKVSAGRLTPRTQASQMPPLSRRCPSSGLKLTLALEDAKGWLSSVQRRLVAIHQELERVRPSPSASGSQNRNGVRGVASCSQQPSATAASTEEQVEKQEKEVATPRMAKAS